MQVFATGASASLLSLDPVLHTKAFAFDDDGVDMMQDAVKDGRGQGFMAGWLQDNVEKGLKAPATR
jgi:hypothetical protein